MRGKKTYLNPFKNKYATAKPNREYFTLYTEAPTQKCVAAEMMCFFLFQHNIKKKNLSDSKFFSSIQCGEIVACWQKLRQHGNGKPDLLRSESVFHVQTQTDLRAAQTEDGALALFPCWQYNEV